MQNIPKQPQRSSSRSRTGAPTSNNTFDDIKKMTCSIVVMRSIVESKKPCLMLAETDLLRRARSITGLMDSLDDTECCCGRDVSEENRFDNTGLAVEDAISTEPASNSSSLVGDLEARRSTIIET